MLDHAAPSLPRSDRQQLVDLLAPVSFDEFMRCHWERRPVAIPGSRAKLDRLGLAGVTSDGFAREVQRAASEARAGFAVGALRSEWAEAAHEQPFVYIKPEAIAEMVAKGASIAIDNFGDTGLAELVAALKLQLRHAGEVRIDAVLSPAGEGFPLHVDKASVIVVQIDGRKRWRFSDQPVLPWPSGTTAFTSAGDVAHRDHVPERWEELERLELPQLREILLEPGDVLYIPAGTLHATAATDEPSLSVSMLFSPCRTIDLIHRVLAKQLGSDPAWRNVPGVAEPGVLTDAAREFLSERLAELRELVNQLTPDDLALQCEWQQRLADPGEATRARLVPASIDEAFVIEPTTRLRRSSRAPITYVQGADVDGEAWLTAFHRDRELSVDAEWTAFLRTLLASEPFVAADAMRWSDRGMAHPWEAVRDALHALLLDGVLERV